VIQVIRRFLKRENGQDLAEYCLMTALVALIALGIFWRVSGGIQGLWGTANSTLANSSAPSTTTQH